MRFLSAGLSELFEGRASLAVPIVIGISVGENCFGDANLVSIIFDRNQKNACLMMLKHALVRCNPLQSRVLRKKAYDAQTKNPT